MSKQLLKLNFGLSVLKSENAMVNLILKEMREQLAGCDMEVLRNNPQLVYDVCNCVENAVTKKKLNKKNIVLKVFTELFPECDIERVDLDIETGLNNGVIKKHTLLTTCLQALFTFFLKK
jgi:hypothetical protein